MAANVLTAIETNRIKSHPILHLGMLVIFHINHIRLLIAVQATILGISVG